MSRIQEYVERLFESIPDSERKFQLKQEIIQNLEEKVHDLIEEGKSEEDAVNKAIVEFGDIDDIKAEMLGGSINTATKKNNPAFALGFSIWGSALCIGLFIFMNLSYTPRTIWFIYPAFIIIWWPLVMYFLWRSRRQGGKR